MEFILLLLVSYYLANNLFTNAAYAVRGLDPPRHKERMARLQNGGRAPAGKYRSGRNGAQRFFAELWHDSWDDAHNKRQELRERRQAKQTVQAMVVPEPVEPAAPEAQPDGHVDTPGALRPQQDGEGDGNVIPFSARTRRTTPPSGDSPTATAAHPDPAHRMYRNLGASAPPRPCEGCSFVDQPLGGKVRWREDVPQPGDLCDECYRARRIEEPNGSDSGTGATAAVVHSGPSPYEVPDGHPSEFPLGTAEEFMVRTALLDGDTGPVIKGLRAKLEEADGAPVPVTAEEEEALLRARGVSPEDARQIVTSAHAAAQHMGGTRMARLTPQAVEAHEQPATDGGSVQEENTQEGIQMPSMTSNDATGQPSGETAGLGSAIRFTSSMAFSLRDAANRTETSIASLTSSEVGEAPLAALRQAMELTVQAANQFEFTQTELEKQVSVKEAYAAAPDAGNKKFLLSD